MFNLYRKALTLLCLLGIFLLYWWYDHGPYPVHISQMASHWPEQWLLIGLVCAWIYTDPRVEITHPHLYQLSCWTALGLALVSHEMWFSIHLLFAFTFFLSRSYLIYLNKPDWKIITWFGIIYVIKVVIVCIYIDEWLSHYFGMNVPKGARKQYNTHFERIKVEYTERSAFLQYVHVASLLCLD